jgi:ketosteroid isomerase-like protein
MSQADVETLRSIYEAAGRGDWDAVAHHARPDFEWITPDRDPIAGTYRGPEAVRQFIEDRWEAFEEVAVEPEAFFERGDRIVVFVRSRLRPRGSTAVVQNRIGQLWTMRNGKAARCETFPQREKALEAVGLSEQDAHSDS